MDLGIPDLVKNVNELRLAKCNIFQHEIRKKLSRQRTGANDDIFELW